MAIACLADRAPCFPLRIWRTSSRTNSPACVLGALPSRRSFGSAGDGFLVRHGVALLCSMGGPVRDRFRAAAKSYNGPKSLLVNAAVAAAAKHVLHHGTPPA
jgi:hypothetical protein